MLTTSIRLSKTIRDNTRSLVERMSPRSSYIGRHRRRSSTPAQLSRVTALICRRNRGHVNEIHMTQELPIITDKSRADPDVTQPKVLGYY